MKLLILTQKVDKNDPVLGFFHNWILELASNFERLSVVCLQKGDYDLPPNVKVLSLDKENLTTNYLLLTTKLYKIKYIWNFYKYIWCLRKDYDAVFVHMNQEYVILGWKLWKLWGKKIYFWRNHPKGDFFTRLAVLVSNKVFCTSPQSFTARFRKTILMPVGIDASIFNAELRIKNQELSKKNILFLGRMDRIKRPNLLIEALDILHKKQIDFVCNLYGDPTSGSEEFYKSLTERVLELGLQEKVHFYAGVPNSQTPELYSSHEIFVNLTPAGSMDKTIVEASACGCLLVVANSSFRGSLDELFILEEVEAQSLAEALQNLMNLNESEKEIKRQKLVEYAKGQSLEILIEKLMNTIQNA